jgi:hypothetical protein
VSSTSASRQAAYLPGLAPAAAGKTTAIKLLSNFVSPTRGSAIAPRGDGVFGQIAPILPVIQREYPTQAWEAPWSLPLNSFQHS